MPTYSYRCTECDNAFDIHQAFTDDTLTVCPVCGGKLRKVFSPVGVTFSGSGFYRTDSRAKPDSSSSSSGSSSSSSGGADSSGGTSTPAPKKEASTPAASGSSPVVEWHKQSPVDGQHEQLGTKMIKGFKEFVLRGNVIDLAVAVVIGAAFTGIVNAIVGSVFNPLIGALFNAESLAKALPVDVPTTSGGVATMYFGAVIAAVIQFLLVALVVYFALIVPINYLKRVSFKKKEEGTAEVTDAPPTELELLAEIRDLLAAQKA